MLEVAVNIIAAKRPPRRLQNDGPFVMTCYRYISSSSACSDSATYVRILVSICAQRRTHTLLHTLANYRVGS
jgi:hypothetical protein